MECRRLRRLGFDPWVEKIPWRRKCQAAPIFLPGESHGQRSLAAYSLVWKIPWRRKCQAAPIVLPGESHGQRSLAGYSLVSQGVGHDWTIECTCVCACAHTHSLSNSDLHPYLLTEPWIIQAIGSVPLILQKLRSLFGVREWILTNLRSWCLHPPSARRDSVGRMWHSLVHQDNKSAQTLPFLESQPQEDTELCFLPFLFIGKLVLWRPSDNHKRKAERTGKTDMNHECPDFGSFALNLSTFSRLLILQNY